MSEVLRQFDGQPLALPNVAYNTRAVRDMDLDRVQSRELAQQSLLAEPQRAEESRLRALLATPDAA